MNRITTAIIAVIVTAFHAVAEYEVPSPAEGLWPESPHAAKLAVVTSPVPAMATGAAQFSIPLYTLTVGDLSIPLSLAYHSNGIKLDEDPYPIGYGWSFLPALRVTRQILGRPDEDFRFVGNTSADSIDHRTAYYCMVREEEIDYDPAWLDTERDVFTVHMPGESFKMLYVDGRFVAPGYGDYVIEGDLAYGGIHITDPQGRRWEFNNRGALVDNRNPTEWCLTKVTLQDGRRVEFDWKLGLHVLAPSYDRESLTSFYHKYSYPPVILGESQQLAGPTPSKEASNLSHIKFPGGEVRLEYMSESRSVSMLRTVTVSSDSGAVQTIRLGHDAGGEKGRFLRYVELGNGDRYSFEYDEREFVPAPSQDYWGYYNGRTRNGVSGPQLSTSGIDQKGLNPVFTGSDRTPDGDAAQARILRRITYPTGGTAEFEYEPHRFEAKKFADCRQVADNRGLVSSGGGLRVRSVTLRESASDSAGIRTEYVYGPGGDGMAKAERLPLASSFLSLSVLIFPYEHFINPQSSQKRFYDYGMATVSTNSDVDDYSFGDPAIWYEEVTETGPEGKTVHRFDKSGRNHVYRDENLHNVPHSIGTLFTYGVFEKCTEVYAGGGDSMRLVEKTENMLESDASGFSVRSTHIYRKVVQSDDPRTAPDLCDTLYFSVSNKGVYFFDDGHIYSRTNYWVDLVYDRPSMKRTSFYRDNGTVTRTVRYEYVPGTRRVSRETLTDGADTVATEYFYADSRFYSDSLTSYRVAEMVAANAVGTVLGARQTFRGARQSWHTLNDLSGSAFRPIRVYRRRGDGPAWNDGLYQWNTDGTLRSHSGTDNIRTSWTWDTHGRYPLSRQTGDPGSGPSLTERLEWKPLVGVSAYVDPVGVRTEYGYDGACRLASVRIGGDLRQTYAYTVSRSGNSRISSRTYTSATAFAESVERFDGLGRPRASFVQAPGGMAATLTQYDTTGRPWRQWAPAPVTSDAATDADIMSASVNFHNDGMPYTETAYEPSPRELATALTNSGEPWHSSGRSSSVRHLANDGGAHACPRYRLTSSGVEYKGNYPPGLLEVEEATDEDGTVAETYTDLRGLTVMTRRAGLATAYVYNDYGELCWVLTPAMAKNRSYDADDKEADDYAYRYEYDATGLLASKKLPGRAAVHYRYDTARRPAMERDGLTGDAWRIRLYDRLGREVVTGMAYWPESQIREYLSNAKGFVYSGGEACAGYEHFGYRPPITVISSRRYNGLGQLVWEGNRTAETSYAYDRLGRVSSRTTSAWFGTSCEEYSYTYTGNPSETLTTVTADTTVYPSTKVVYTYDTADRLVKTEAFRGGSSSPAVLTTSYDAVGRVARTDMGQAYRRHSYDVHGWPDSTVTYLEPLLAGHTSGGNPVLFRAAAPGTYPPPGDSLEIDRPVVVFPPDTARLDSIRTEIARRHFTERLLYASGKYPCFNGNISAKADRRGRYDYRYDNAGRLVAAEFTPSGEGGTEDYSTGYAYDANSNLTALTRHGVTDITGGTRTYGVLDRLDYTLDGNRPGRVESSGEGTPYRGRTGMGVGGSWSYGYDANGNVTLDESRGITDIAYNHANQATDIWLSDGWRVVTSYGPDGTKLRSALASPEGWGVTVRKYLGNLVIEDDRVVQQLFPGGYFDAEGNAYYYLTDYQGNVTGVIDSNAKIVQETGYYPYGEPWLEPEGDNPYLYGGKERMALGGVRYSDFGPRLLSTASGYWGSPDPLCEEYRDLSPYINCAANPVRYIDPSGMYIVEESKNKWEKMISSVTKKMDKLSKDIEKIKKKGSEKQWSNEKIQNKLGDKAERLNSLENTLATMTEISESTQGYSLHHVSENTGDIKYDPTSGNIQVVYTDDANLVHEITHCGQFEHGKIGFNKENGNALFVDVFDEVNAYRSQYAFSSRSVSLIPSSVKINNSEDITPEWVLGITVDGEKFYKNLGILPVNPKSSMLKVMKSYNMIQNQEAHYNKIMQNLYAR